MFKLNKFSLWEGYENTRNIRDNHAQYPHCINRIDELEDKTKLLQDTILPSETFLYAFIEA